VVTKSWLGRAFWQDRRLASYTCRYETRFAHRVGTGLAVIAAENAAESKDRTDDNVAAIPTDHPARLPR